MNPTPDLKKLFDATKANLDEYGFVGMDYNMCVLCVIARRTGRKLKFMEGRIPATGMERTYDDKLTYWIGKLQWMNHVHTEDELLADAAKRYNV